MALLLRLGEQVLAEGECTKAIGPLTVRGKILLTSQRVYFEPSALNRIMGAQAWVLDLDALVSVCFDEKNARLVLEDNATVQRLSGFGARVVYEVLAPLRAAEGTSTGVHERVLLLADAEIEATDLLSAVGEVTVTTRRLRFRLRRLERAIWPGLELDVPLEDVRSFRVHGIRRRLEVQCGERTVRFSGPVVPALYGALRASAELAAGTVTADGLEHEVWPTELYRDPLSYPGALVRTGTALTYISTGTLDALIGLEQVLEMPLNAIERIAIRGRIDRRLEITTSETRSSFAIGDLRTRYESLIAWMADYAKGPVCLGGESSEVDRNAIAAILAPWHPTSPIPATPLLFCPAVRISERAGAEPGWLIIDSAQFIWLPGAGPGVGASAFRVPLDEPTFFLVSAPANELHLQTAGGALHRWRLASETSAASASAGEPEAGGVAPIFRRALKGHLAEIDTPSEERGMKFVAAPDAGASRRKTFRVSVAPGHVSDLYFWIRIDDVLERMDCELADWSLSGCAVRVASRVPRTAQIRVDLRVGTEIHPLQAEIVFDRKLPDGEGWLTGMRFIGNWGEIEHATRGLWLDLQRAAASRAHSKKNRKPG